MALFKRKQDEPTQRGQPIGEEQVRQAELTLRDYKDGKSALEARIVENEKWYRMQHWEAIRGRSNPNDPEPASAWTFNAVANKHADAMDNYPEPVVLPREESDVETAYLLSEILPVVLEQNNFEQVYSDLWWYKLKMGTGAYGVFWSPSKNNGLGDIDIRKLDLLNLFWEPGIEDIQKSRNLFHVDLYDRDLMIQRYPQLEEEAKTATIDVKQYAYDDTVKTDHKLAVVDWYYKKTSSTGKTLLHFCKFCNGKVLYASENMPDLADRGFYDHADYPVVFDTLFPIAGSPAGFGYIDVCKDPQLYIDKLDQYIQKHAQMAAMPRWFTREDSIINEKDFADWSKPFVKFTGNRDPRDSMLQIEVPGLPAEAIAVRDAKIEELKETSGNRDFSQGGTTSGVTAASAIAALQEAGSKLSRDMIGMSYFNSGKVDYLCIELIRQFYQEDRWFRVVGERGEVQFRQFSGGMISPQAQGDDFGLDLGSRAPVFDIKVKAQKASPFSTVAQNERAKELYGMGFFRPDLADQALAALDMMTFEGKDAVAGRIAQNGTLYQQMQMMIQQMVKMGMVIDEMRGTTIAQGVAQQFGMQGMGAPGQAQGNEAQTNSLGDSMNAGRNSTAGAARAQAARSATPR